MGYFSNGFSVEAYVHNYCEHCVHGLPEDDFNCPVMNAHLDASPSQMSRRTSILHTFIPRAEDCQNGRCNMFVPIVNNENSPKPEAKRLNSIGKTSR